MLRKTLSLALSLALCLGLTTPALAAAEAAIPTKDALICDGVPQAPTVYKINGSNYFKLRDLAVILNGTGKQFSVGYDEALRSVTVTTGTGYVEPDTGLTTVPAGGERPAQISGDAIYVNGIKAEAEVYKIDGVNYFKLRDLGAALDFYVGWDGATGTVALDTARGYEAPALPDNSQTAMAGAMLDILNRGSFRNVCLEDTDGDGMKELIVLDESSAMLYDWSSGQLSSRGIGGLAGGQIDWWLCQDTTTGELGIKYQVSGANYDSCTLFFSGREVCLNHFHGDDDSNDFNTYEVDGHETGQEEYGAAMDRYRQLGYLCGDFDSNGADQLTLVRAELECLAAGKSLRDISDEALLLIAQRLEDSFSAMSIGIMNGWPTECDYSDFIMIDEGYGPFEYYRVIGYTSVDDILRTAEERWYQSVSRSCGTFELMLAPNIRERYIARNGALYRHDLGMGDGGIFNEITRLVSREGDRAVFGGNATHGDDICGSFDDMVIVFEDGAWKYAGQAAAVR